MAALPVCVDFGLSAAVPPLALVVAIAVIRFFFLHFAQAILRRSNSFCLALSSRKHSQEETPHGNT
jgi:hypothetical protein